MSSHKHPKFNLKFLIEAFGSLEKFSLETQFYRLGRRVVTTVEIFDVEGKRVGQGASIRMPTDRYNKNLGEEIALGRAIKNWYDANRVPVI